MTHDEYQLKMTREALAIAYAVCGGNFDVVAGARRLAELRSEVRDELRNDFGDFQAVESETELFPLEPELRARFGADYLQRLDREIAAYVAAHGEWIQIACTKLIERIGRLESFMTIVTAGDQNLLAVESGIFDVSARRSQLALGYFVIHLHGAAFGVRAPDATMLGCSFGEVEERVGHRGGHFAPEFAEFSADELARATMAALYDPEQENAVFRGLSTETISDILCSRRLLWAPDGDEAFDDSSKILQLDVGDRVRLIGFRSTESFVPEPGSVQEVWLDADDFYTVLSSWHAAFEEAWYDLLHEAGKRPD